MSNAERTLIILKPDAVHRRLAGEILRRFEQKGLKVAGLKLARLDPSKLEVHYADHRQKPFYGSLVEFMTAGPVILCVLEGPRAIEVARKLMGKTFAHQAEPGTIRGDLGISGQFNLIHGSDSPDAARREIELFFSPSEIFDYEIADERWLKE
jgi:nucleoside-diphosphate kinase